MSELDEGMSRVDELKDQLHECKENYAEMREEAKQSADENFRLRLELEQLKIGAESWAIVLDEARNIIREAAVWKNLAGDDAKEWMKKYGDKK